MLPSEKPESDMLECRRNRSAAYKAGDIQAGDYWDARTQIEDGYQRQIDQIWAFRGQQPMAQTSAELQDALEERTLRTNEFERAGRDPGVRPSPGIVGPDSFWYRHPSARRF